MKMLKKATALTIAVLMLLTAMTFTALAAEEYTGTVQWLYPTQHTTKSGNYVGAHTGITTGGYTFNSTVWRNGNCTGTNAFFDLKANSTLAVAYDVPSDYSFVRTALGSSWKQKSGISYEPLLSDTANPYYEVWVERPAHANGTSVDLTLEISGDDGVYTVTVPGAKSTSGWYREMYFIGNIKLSDAINNRVNIWLPLDKSYYGSADTKPEGVTLNDFIAFGGVKLVQIAGIPEQTLSPLTRSTVVLEPARDMFTGWGGGVALGTATYGSFTNFSDPYGLDVTDATTERSFSTSYTESNTKNRRAQIYKGPWNTSESQAGWYKIYIDRITHKTSGTPVPYLTVSVVHKDGTSNFIMDRNSNTSSTDAWQTSRHYVGTFYMGTGSSHQIRVYGPGVYDGTNQLRCDLGAIICVPVDEEEAAAAKTNELTAESDLYLKPVYTADFSNGYTPAEGSEVELYVYDGMYYQLKMDAANGETSVTAAYNADNRDLAEALTFNEGTIDFDLYWSYTQGIGGSEDVSYKAPYFSVILGKSATASAEIRIYSDKAQLIEGETVTDLYVPDDYIFHCYDGSGTPSNTLQTPSWKNNCRIEITDVADEYLKNGIEATSRLKSTAGQNGATKLLKIFLNGGAKSEICLGAVYIPEGSILYEDDNDVTDNYIKFVNNPGAYTTDQTNLIKIRDLSVTVPDKTITSDDLHEEVAAEFNVTNGIASYKLNAYIPYKHANLLGAPFSKKNYANIIASYDSSINLLDTASAEKTLETGNNTTIDLSLDVGNASSVKFFRWDSFDNMMPYAQAIEKQILSGK